MAAIQPPARGGPPWGATTHSPRITEFIKDFHFKTLSLPHSKAKSLPAVPLYARCSFFNRWSERKVSMYTSDPSRFRMSSMLTPKCFSTMYVIHTCKPFS
jgi:hypothetical protein